VNLVIPPFDGHEFLTEKQRHVLTVRFLLPPQEKVELVHPVNRPVGRKFAASDARECGKKSISATIWLLTRPPGIWPGQRMMHGVRMFPSNTVPISPRHGPASLIVHHGVTAGSGDGPLSLAHTTTVLSAMLAAISASNASDVVVMLTHAIAKLTSWGLAFEIGMGERWMMGERKRHIEKEWPVTFAICCDAIHGVIGHHFERRNSRRDPNHVLISEDIPVLSNRPCDTVWVDSPFEDRIRLGYHVDSRAGIFLRSNGVQPASDVARRPK
jgi:hypothetical protein